MKNNNRVVEIVGVTPQMKRLVTFVRDELLRTDGVSPSYDEIADHLGLASKSGVHRIVQSLIKRGVITVNARSSRSISVVTTEEHSQIFINLQEQTIRELRHNIVELQITLSLYRAKVREANLETMDMMKAYDKVTENDPQNKRSKL